MAAQKTHISVDEHKKQTPPQDDTLLLHEKIAELEKAIVEKDAAHKRAYADYINLQRRTKEDQERFVRFAAATLIEKILEPIDHLTMAADHLKDQALLMIVKQFQLALQQEGLQEIEVLGKIFDSRTMEAVGAVDGAKDVVINVRRKGYTLNGIMVRPALVEVGNGSTANGVDSVTNTKEK